MNKQVRLHCTVCAQLCACCHFLCRSVLPEPVCGPLRGGLGCHCSSGCWHAGLSSSGSRGSWWWRCGCSSRSDADTYCTPYGPVKKRKKKKRKSPAAQQAGFKATHKHKYLVSIGWTPSVEQQRLLPHSYSKMYIMKSI